jgi:hypothetical protein
MSSSSSSSLLSRINHQVIPTAILLCRVGNVDDKAVIECAVHVSDGVRVTMEGAMPTGNDEAIVGGRNPMYVYVRAGEGEVGAQGVLTCARPG